MTIAGGDSEMVIGMAAIGRGGGDGGDDGDRRGGGGSTFGRKGKCLVEWLFFLPRWRAGFLTRPPVRSTCICLGAFYRSSSSSCAARNARKIGASEDASRASSYLIGPSSIRADS